ncbi:MAG TPA: MFS transporter [Thermoanaerobaculia bacterium]
MKAPRRLGRNVFALAAVSLFTDIASEMTYPLLPLFLSSVLGASATAVGGIEGAAESTAALLKLASGWWSDRVARRKPLVVAGYTIASVIRPLIGLARAVSQVLAIRVTDRIGKGIRTSPRDALIADSVDASIRGRAFGFQRAGDHAGAVIGPLIAFALLRWAGLDLRTVFLLTAIPGALAVATLIFGVREVPRAAPAKDEKADLRTPLGRRFWAYLGVLLLFTLGNSTDAFLLLRAGQLGVAPALIPILWALLHVVKSTSSTPGGILSDRFGRRPLILAGWLLYAAVYFAFGRAQAQWQAWALFAVYGVYFGLTEGVEKALVADLVAPERRGAAFGWYNLAIGVGALPASLLFGALWDRWGSTAAFDFGAGLAFAAAIGLSIVVPRRRATPA